MLRGLGCLVLVVAAGIAGWMLRDRIGAERDTRPVASAPIPSWEPLTPEGAARARAAVQKLGGRSGPLYTSVGAGDLSAYVFEELSKQLPPSAENAEAAVIGDQLHVRASIRLRDFGGAKALGPLGDMLGDREPVQFGGTLEVIRSGLAQYRVRSLRVRELSIPSALIPRLIRSIGRGARPAGITDDALPLVIPPFIADARIANGKITLYKRTP